MIEIPMTATEVQQRLAEQDKKIAEQQQKIDTLITEALLAVVKTCEKLLESK